MKCASSIEIFAVKLEVGELLKKLEYFVIRKARQVFKSLKVVRRKISSVACSIRQWHALFLQVHFFCSALLIFNFSVDWKSFSLRRKIARNRIYVERFFSFFRSKNENRIFRGAAVEMARRMFYCFAESFEEFLASWRSLTLTSFNILMNIHFPTAIIFALHRDETSVHPQSN